VLCRLLDVVLKMEKNEKRTVIKYLDMKGLSAQRIHLDNEGSIRRRWIVSHVLHIDIIFSWLWNNSSIDI